MLLSESKRSELLEVVRGVLPGAEWAPEEAWLEDSVGDKAARKGSPSSHFMSTCQCDGGPEPAELALFVKGRLMGQHFNTVARIQHAVEKWAQEGNLVWEGCGVCKDRLYVDVRLFRTDPVKPERLLEDDEIDLLAKESV